MIAEKIVNTENQRLSVLLEKHIGLTYSEIQKLLRNKDVKLNGKRVPSDKNITIGDIVEVYYNEKKIKVLYEDENIIVVFKPRRLETVNESGIDLRTKISKQINIEVFAVHRLDRNTEGLVIFAKNIDAKKALDDAIKNKDIKKYYLAKVVGVPETKEANLIAYLKKDENKSLVYISDLKQNGYDKIMTNYRVIDNLKDYSILEIELLTGKTHQIRAHLSHIGYPILGDEKYGNSKINKINCKKYQCLCAYKLIFKLKKENYLFYLNGLSVELDKKEISFL